MCDNTHRANSMCDNAMPAGVWASHDAKKRESGASRLRGRFLCLLNFALPATILCTMPPSRSKRLMMERTRAWILANPSATIAQTMKATGASQSSISDIRRELLASGVIPQPFAHTPRKKQEEYLNPPPEGVQTTEQLLAANKDALENLLAGTAPLTREERRQKLEALVRVGAADHIIRANEAIEKMDLRDGSKEEIGTQPPQTLEDAIDQVSDMVEALMAWGGEEAVKTALSRGMARFYEDQKLIAKTITAQPDLLGAQGG